MVARYSNSSTAVAQDRGRYWHNSTTTSTMDARDSFDNLGSAHEGTAAQPAGEQEADEDLEDALRELEDARREEERRQENAERRERTQRGEMAERGEARTRERLEMDAYTPGFNPVADANVHAEREQAQRQREEQERREREQAERERKDKEEAERLRLAAVENRTYMIGRARVDMLSDDLIAFRVLREHLVTRDRRENRDNVTRDRESGDNKDSSETKEEVPEEDSSEEGTAGEYRDFEDPELVVVTEQAVCTTEQQARAFAFMQEVDTGRAVVFNRHASSFAGETLRRLVENEHTALRTVETTDRALYPYSFGRPSDKLIAALRVVVLLFAETEEVVSTDTDTGASTETGTETNNEPASSTGTEAGQHARQERRREKGAEPVVRARTRRLLTRESVTVVDKVVEREVQAESTEKEARRERRNRSFVDGPSHRREDAPLTPLRHVNSVQIAIDMTGEGDIRRKEEQFRECPIKAPERGREESVSKA